MCLQDEQRVSALYAVMFTEVTVREARIWYRKLGKDGTVFFLINHSRAAPRHTRPCVRKPGIRVPRN